MVVFARGIVRMEVRTLCTKQWHEGLVIPRRGASSRESEGAYLRAPPGESFSCTRLSALSTPAYSSVRYAEGPR